MKALFFSLMAFAGIASAQTAGDPHINRLLAPPGVAVLPGHTACVGSAFNADGSIVGACRVIHASACSGRGCQPVTLTTTYVANWDVTGAGTSAVACKVVRHHLPQIDVITYADGYDASTCPNLNLNPTGTVVIIDGVPLAYVSTGPSGQELVNDSVGGFLWTP